MKNNLFLWAIYTMAMLVITIGYILGMIVIQERGIPILTHSWNNYTNHAGTPVGQVGSASNTENAGEPKMSKV